MLDKSNRQSCPSDSGDDLLEMWSVHFEQVVNGNVLSRLAASFDLGIIEVRNGYLLLVSVPRRYSGLGRDESGHEDVIIHVACVIVVYR